MLHITLGPKKAADKDDALNRAYVGYDAGMSEQELYEANRGCWVLGPRADSERFMLMSFEGVVRQAVEIERIVPAGSRRAVEGRILGPGDAVHDKYVGQPSPVGQVRNPITYFEEEESQEHLCACGCGQAMTSKRDFLPGHDQRAIHARIARVGSVKDFLDWFDRTWTAA